MTSLLTNEPRTPRRHLRLVDHQSDRGNDLERWDEQVLSRADRWMLSLGIFVACALIAVVERLPKRRPSKGHRNPDTYHWGVCGVTVVNSRPPHSVLQYDEW